jgi:uncharacterized 2Fe-2S/4Fe-4S cluster protein (DUF4445 family)
MTIRRHVQRVVLEAPSLADNTADAERLMAASRAAFGAARIEIAPALLADLPQRLRQARWRLRVVGFALGEHCTLLEVRPIDEERTLAGLAVDLGTTRIVMRLVDLDSGARLAETSLDNPQRVFGPDILSRLHHAQEPSGRDQLRLLAVAALNRGAGTLCRAAGLQPNDLVLAAVAGNTAMAHLLLGLDPHWMIREPYIPAVNRPGLLRAADLGLRLHPGAGVYLFPNVGSYFGGDLLAGILAAGLDQSEETSLLVDVGTNAEVVVGNRHWLMACAGAAGPALEGGVTRIGMTAETGAIDRVSSDPQSGELVFGTIGDGAPRGICGSGLIDLAAVLFRTGMIDLRGKLVAARCGQRLTVIDGLAHFVLVPAAAAGGRALTISQADLDSLVRSKAAMFTILETLTGAVGVTLEELRTFMVAGTFGAFIDPHSAITIGMLPDLPRERFRTLGNSSLEGATRLLAGELQAAAAEQVRDRITYLELNVNQEFMNRFSAAKFIPHTDRSRFPSVS